MIHELTDPIQGGHSSEMSLEIIVGCSVGSFVVGIIIILVIACALCCCIRLRRRCYMHIAGRRYRSAQGRYQSLGVEQRSGTRRYPSGLYEGLYDGSSTDTGSETVSDEAITFIPDDPLLPRSGLRIQAAPRSLLDDGVSFSLSEESPELLLPYEFGTGESFSDDPLLPVSRLQTQAASRSSLPQLETKHPVLCERKILKNIKSNKIPDCPECLVDLVEVILCDEFGGIYHNPLHGITLVIPEGAISVGMELKISIGVLLHGNFDFPIGISPVSAIVWLCTPQPNFTFSKPVEVIIPHFMDCTSNDDAAGLQMQFMKASHWSPDKANLQFVYADGVQDFGTIAYKGVLRTQHFCYLCVTSGVTHKDLKGKRFCISCAKPRSQFTKTPIFFFITYLLETCMQDVESKLPVGYHIAERRPFRFQTSRLRPGICTDYQCSQPLTVSLQPAKISMDRVNFWQLHLNGELKVMEKNGLYPPRMALEISEVPSTPVTITVTFRGTQESKLETVITITLPYSEVTSSAQPTSDSFSAEAVTPVLTACPSICQLHRLKGDNQKDSLRLIEHLAPRWEQLGITLDFDPRGVHVDLIKKECTNEGPVGCCNRVLKDWLNGKGARAYQPPTWANFITILEEMEEFHLVRSLQTYFCTGPY